MQTVDWDGMGDGMGCDGMRWDAMGWDAMWMDGLGWPGHGWRAEPRGTDIYKAAGGRLECRSIETPPSIPVSP